MFVVIGLAAWPIFKKVVPGQPADTTSVFAPERTPQEIITAYQTELQTVVSVVQSPATASATAHAALEKFFFSVRVPDAARNAHLKAALAFQNTDPKKTESQKVTTWQEILTQLQTAAAGL